MRSVAIIPSRYASTRLEGKPLIDIAGKPLVQWVYEAVQKARLVDRIIVATDDGRVVDAVNHFGGEVCLTSPHHSSGTDRIAEIASQLTCDVIINVQGDEPLIDPQLIDEMVRVLSGDATIYMTSAYAPLQLQDEIANPHVVKVVVDRRGYALYFSRAPIPYRFPEQTGSPFARSFKHIGLYGFRKAFLMEFVRWGPSPLEREERLEQLRVLENGYQIKMVYTDCDSIGVDTREDVERVIERMKGVHEKC